MNSFTLQVLGMDVDTLDPAPWLSEFVREPGGEPTRWVKEFAPVGVAGYPRTQAAMQLTMATPSTNFRKVS